MKIMKIEKKILFSDKIIGVDHLQAKAALTYQEERDGSVRALGPLFVQGNVHSEVDVQPFQEVLDLDVLAPAYKLDGSGFFLQVENCFGEVDEDGINVNIQMGIQGLIEDHNDVIDAKDHEVNKDHPQAMPIAEERQMIQDTLVDADVEENTNMAMDEFEDLFEDADTTYTSYRMVVAKPQDSYEEIAKRYDVNVEDLKQVNRNKDVVAKSLIVLPF